MSRALTLVLGAGFAVVGGAGAASAWDAHISGTVECATSGGWAVTWEVDNSESQTATITESNRPAAVPVGTTLGADETRQFTETITTKPTSDLTLMLSTEWDTDTSEDEGSISVSEFSDDCILPATPPTVPVVDPCGPGNAQYGPVPAGPWTATTNPDGSVTVTANAGYSFPDGATTITYPAPTDSNTPCPTTPPVVTPPVVTPPVVTPPVVTPPQVAPAAVRVVRAAARRMDKCGTRSDMLRVAKRSGVVYKAKGKVLREGVWLKARTRSMTVRATAANATVRLEGKQVWRMRFTNKPCAQAPEVAPDTGA